MSITELSVKRPTLVVVLFSILVFFGLYGYSSLTYELLPNISSPVITVSTIYPGASPSEVENSVTKPIESALSSIENLESIQATSMESFSIVIVELKYGSNEDIAMQNAQRKIDAIAADLPDDAKKSSVDKFSLAEAPIMRMGATSTMEDVEFTNIFTELIQPELARIEGVAQVNIIGGADREININVDGDKLKYYNLSILQLSQAIARSNLNFPTGSIKDEHQDVLVRLSGKIQDLDRLRNLSVMTTKEGSQVLLSDVAEVYDTKKDFETISRINGRPSLGITISKQSDGNAVEVSEKVNAKIAELEERYADENLKFEISNDSSIFTLEAAHHVVNDLVLAVILVALIMLFFLHNIRNAIIVMIAIPVSIISTFAVMSMAGFTLNLMTLLALSLVIGILVDDSIVVLENIHARMENGASAREAAIGTWNEIGMSVFSITLVIVVVFLPIALVTGLVADLLRQFSLVVVAATVISLVVSFTLTPWLASRFTKLTHLNIKNKFHWPLIGFEKLIKGFENFYRSMLNLTLKHKLLSMILIFALVFSSMKLVSNGYIGSEFVAAGDVGEFLITMEMPKETPLDQNNMISQEVEKYLLDQPEVTNVFTTVGQSSGLLSTTSTAYMTEINVKLVSSDERSMTSDEYARMVKAQLSDNIPGVKFSAKAVSMVSGATEAPIQLTIQGNNIDELLEFSDDFIDEIKTIPGTAEVKSTVEGGNPEISVDIDREKLADLGLTLDVVGLTMQNAFTGNTDTKFQDGVYEYDIRIQLDAFNRKNVDDISELTFLNNEGKLIKLSQFASIVESSGPSRLERQDKISSLTIESQIIGRDIASIGEDIQSKMDAMDIPAGISISQGGDLERQADAFGSLAFALITSILLVYLIMVALYDSYVYPFVVLFSIPVALIGALLALALAMENLSIFGMLGLIMLVGLVVKNAILIVDFVNQLKREGMDRKKAVIEGTLQRFRPILMTTIAMVIAMVPIAIASGAGSEWKNGLAWVLIGGLTSSMLLTMIVVPIAYRLMDDIGEWISKKFGSKKNSSMADNMKGNATPLPSSVEL
ncbi:efflux RND transporter permease subunit [Membranihabitans marinus]|uniref:efflux RND transporter permease subunit n=1 Tax=Membranihabitans marinus TaxID=1227546 RepID=UPI001F2FD91F|nr:efflux RND transporter permease subunit [Membranihabitans marinus]